MSSQIFHCYCKNRINKKYEFDSIEYSKKIGYFHIGSRFDKNDREIWYLLCSTEALGIYGNLVRNNSGPNENILYFKSLKELEDFIREFNCKICNICKTERLLNV